MKYHGYSLDTVTSTQDVAREKALEGAPPWTYIQARFQTGGRGRQGRTWFAPHGANVTLTVIGPPVAHADAWQVALLAGVAVAEALREMPAEPALDARLRFPNDVTVGGRKIAGVLVETVAQPTRGFVTPLIGVGVNVNVAEEEFPEELRERATSVQRELGRRIDLADYPTLPILERLQAIWEEYRRGPLEESVLPRWRALADPDARRRFVLAGAPEVCRVLDLAADGSVYLETEDGRRVTVAAAQVILGDE